MFDFFFKYSPVVYEQGQWVFRAMPALITLMILAVIAVLLTLLFYRRTTTPVRRLWHGLLIILRVLAIAVVIFCLLEPVLSVSTVVPRKSSVLVLVDDSESMSIADGAQRATRLQQVTTWLGDGVSANSALARLQKNFRLETFRFSSAVEPISGIGELRGKGQSTNLAAALEFAGKQARQEALAGVVLITDGVASAGADPLQVSRDLIGLQVPIFTIGAGAKIANDLQVAKIEATRSVLEKARVEVTAMLQARGHAGETVAVELREGGKIVQRQNVTLGERGGRVAFQFTPARKGFIKYTVAAPSVRNEAVTANNEMSFLIDSRDRTARILYVEELHPWEFKFLSRAVDGDPALQLTSLLKTGPEKYLRLGLRNASELRDGFPTTREELFGYQAVVIGSMPAAFFSAAQLSLIRDFVAERGGGFMMLGGMKALSQGGYSNTAVDELLPVQLLPLPEADGRAFPPQLQEEFRFTPTPEGLASPLLQLDSDPVSNSRRWESLPLLQGYNPLGSAKPGASLLAVHPMHQTGAPRILLATQRFGRGRTAVLATSTTWRWQMHLDHHDMTHERFWRQLLRWLSLQSPDPVRITLERENFSPSENMTMQVSVMDSSFAGKENANVELRVIAPNGEPMTLTASPDLRQPGNYVAHFEPSQEGLYTVEVLAHDQAGHFLGKAENAFFVEPSHAELAHADLQAPLLQRLAEVTGGRYFHLSEAGNLPDAITVSKNSYSKLTEQEIWDAPIFFLAITLLLAAEWFVRRSKGLS
ncbi:MAG: glutamine amidotransferase [candidate division KSB1 bacterium]|nr:glutamine amidotransferase [candidate division KSB1 bacterium]MDZ7364453.1 glutamine amidotransferase [candidate division KSB1 bacterium]MDZ7402825.1 glutamine amidotransferase [candidate division KSB1 bacterium]